VAGNSWSRISKQPMRSRVMKGRGFFFFQVVFGVESGYSIPHFSIGQ
jgi:hypothetical protein